MDLKKIKIGVLGGGISEEREISILSAKQAYQSLQANRLNPVFIDINRSKKKKVKDLIKSYNIDTAFIALHGKFGEDGKIQAILEDLNLPYTGSRPQACLLTMDKILSKKTFFKKRIPTPDFIVQLNKKVELQNVSYPVVVKPYFSGSSLGISIVKSKAGLKRACQKAFSYQSKIILEDYIEGRELTVGILDKKPLGVVEIVPKKTYYDFDAKYKDGMSEFIAPAKLRDRVYKQVQDVSLLAHKALGCRHFSRVDIRLSKDNVPYVLEVNSIPGLTSHSLLPLSALCCGIDFNRLILLMVKLSLSKRSLKK
jgi:D-alanine-D-alanine ligase